MLALTLVTGLRASVELLYMAALAAAGAAVETPLGQLGRERMVALLPHIRLSLAAVALVEL